MRLVALKANKYGTRHLTAGEQFDMPEPYAQTLLVTGLAKRAPTAFHVDDVVIGLRAEAQALGVDVDNRWGKRRLRAEIKMARGS